MVATDVQVASDVIFAWNFEEGTPGETIVCASGYPSKDYDSADNNKVYSLHKEILPQYANGYGSSRDVFYGEEKMHWKNGVCAYYRGYHSLAEGTSLRGYTGTEMNLPGSSLAVRNPCSWTMEAFVKVEYERDNALIFGKHGQLMAHATSPASYPQICWMLTTGKNGIMKVSWTLAGLDSYSANTVMSASTSEGTLVPNQWHHVALTYDSQIKKFGLYVDYRKVLEPDVDGELLDVPSAYYFSRIECSNAFEGWMDEIRFSSVARTPESFVHLAPIGLRLILR
jgi:hypothetical protein